MRWSSPVALLVAVGIAIAVLGSVLTLAGRTLGFGGRAPVFVQGAIATVALLVVALLVAVVLGLRGAEDASTPYW